MSTKTGITRRAFLKRSMTVAAGQPATGRVGAAEHQPVGIPACPVCRAPFGDA